MHSTLFKRIKKTFIQNKTNTVEVSRFSTATGCTKVPIRTQLNIALTIVIHKEYDTIVVNNKHITAN